MKEKDMDAYCLKVHNRRVRQDIRTSRFEFFVGIALTAFLAGLVILIPVIVLTATFYGVEQMFGSAENPRHAYIAGLCMGVFAGVVSYLALAREIYYDFKRFFDEHKSSMDYHKKKLNVLPWEQYEPDDYDEEDEDQ
jgi:uncharacterized membrane protein